MLVTVPVANMISGVSRQSPTIRFPSQCQEQVNCRSSLIDGLTKRPPTRHVAKMSNIDVTSGVKVQDSLVHFIDRDPSERYAVLVRGDVASSAGRLSVMGVDGVSYTVEYQDNDARDYLDVADPKSDLRMLTIADFTFVLNTKKTAATLTTTQPSTARNPEMLITVVSGTFSNSYTVRINASVFTYTTPASSTTSNPPVGLEAIQTTTIAQGLVDLMLADSTFTSPTGWDVTRQGSVIHIQRKTASGFTASVEDGQSNTQLLLAKDIVDGIEQLPTTAPRGYRIRVEGFPEENIGAYWVEFVTNSTNVNFNFSPGYWKESVAPGIQFRLDAKTMPHALKRLPDTQAPGGIKFRLERLSWGDRTVGDLVNNADPSFVGRRINSLFFFQNRLGFLVDPDYVVLSESAEYFNFFRTTVVTVVDSDPIDVAVASDDVNELRAAVPFAEDLVLFSATSQFVLDSPSGPLSPSSISVKRSTRYDALLNASPQTTGRSILFAQRHGDSSGLMEYVRDPRTEVFTGIDVTANVRSYIEGPIRQIAVSDSVNMAVVSTDGPRLLQARTAPVSVSPSTETTQATGELVTFTWLGVPGATWYQLWVSEAPGAVPIANPWVLLSATTLDGQNVSYTLPTAIPDGNWAWWVRAWSPSTGNTAWSPARNFTVGSGGGLASITEGDPDEEDGDAVDPNISDGLDPFLDGIHAGMANSTFVTDDGTTATLYAYSYFLNGDEKVQSAWSKWTFPGASKVLGFSWIETNLYLAVVRADGIFLERMQVEDNLSDSGIGFVMHLDRRVSANEMTSVEYDAARDHTTIVLPYKAPQPSEISVVNGGFSCVVLNAVSSGSTTTITLRGLQNFPSLCAGVPYRMLYEFSEVFPRSEQQAATHGRFGLTYGRLLYDRTGYMKVLVLPTARNLYEYEFTGYEATTSDRLNRPYPISSGDFRFPIHARNREVRMAVVNDTHVPTRLMSAEFEGNFVARSQRT